MTLLQQCKDNLHLPYSRIHKSLLKTDSLSPPSQPQFLQLFCRLHYTHQLQNSKTAFHTPHKVQESLPYLYLFCPFQLHIRCMINHSLLFLIHHHFLEYDFLMRFPSHFSKDFNKLSKF